MLKYKELNVNPKHRKTGDCSTRALCGVLNISYEECLKLQFEESLKCYYDPTSKQVIERVLAKFGYIKMPQPKYLDGTKYEVKDLDKILTYDELSNGVLVTVANHHTCVRDDYIQDIWNCGRKCVGNYYVKLNVKK